MATKALNAHFKGMGEKPKVSASKSNLHQSQSNKPSSAKPLTSRNQIKPSAGQGQSGKKVTQSGRGNLPENARSLAKQTNSQAKVGSNDHRNHAIASETNGLQKRSFISEQEIADMLGGLEMDRNNNVRESQESLNTAGAACLVHIAKVYAAQQKAFDRLEGSKLVEDVLLKGKFWRDSLSAAEERKDSINVYGLKIVFHSPSMSEMSKKRFFACIHLHNALRNFGIRSALAVHIDISSIRHRKVSEISHRIIQLVGDGYNFFALQFKVEQTDEGMRKLFNEPGAYGVYIGFAFILDYLAYRNKCKKHNVNVEYDIKKYVEVLGDEGYVIRGIDKSAGSSQFEFEVTQEDEDLHLEYVEHLFNGIKFK